MENSPTDLGPRAADDDVADAGPVPLSAQRAQVLEELGRSGPHTVATLAGAVGLHQNTVREHLDGLVELHLVTRQRLPSTGRGRPAWRYAGRPSGRSATMRDHVALATVLAGHLARTSASPARDAAAAGREWGQALVAGRDAQAGSTGARREVVALLDEIGFAPEPDADARAVRLRRCPILDVARRHPEVVCSVHTGLVTAALEHLGATDDAAAVTLQPFAEPGACVLQLGAPRPS